MDEHFLIREARVEDAVTLIELMRGLAEFEGYLDRFAVTPEDLRERGFSAQGEPQFHVLVAERSQVLVGYALTYVIPFTFDLRPTLVLKEFFVAPPFRGEGIGKALFEAVAERGKHLCARLLRFQVLPDNASAARFYASFGAAVDAAWDNWVLELE